MLRRILFTPIYLMADRIGEALNLGDISIAGNWEMDSVGKRVHMGWN
jgi:hypothetical protein